MKSIIISFAFIGISLAQGSKRTEFLVIGQFECEGKDGSNYTYIAQYSEDAACTASIASYIGKDTAYFITNKRNGEKLLNVLTVLVESGHAEGAYLKYQVLYLATSGNLEGKYLYLKEIGLSESYLKKCSSVLGYSYNMTKSQVLLIADKLDPNVLISITGAFEPFKKSATTICQGRSITV